MTCHDTLGIITASIYIVICYKLFDNTIMIHAYIFPYTSYLVPITIGSILNPLTGKFSEDTRKKGKGTKTGASHDWRSF